MVTRARWFFLASLSSCLPVAAHAHPLHTTMTRVTLEAPRQRTLRLMIRTFAEDYLAAAGGRVPLASADIGGPASYAYLRRMVRLEDDGRPLPLRSCGARITADVAWLCVEADVPGDARRVTLHNQLLCERYSDQVNIVQLAISSPERSMLFVKGDLPKRIITGSSRP